MIKSFMIFIFFSVIIFSQVETERWGKAEVNYVNFIKHNNHAAKSHSNGIFSYIRDFYGFTFSDLDGDNCPFYPSCSVFFVESVEQTNLFKGALMFADRFTRDSNILKSLKVYPRYSSGKYYDPVVNYTLDNSKIIYLHHEKIYDE